MSLEFINDETIKKLLDWNSLIPAMKNALIDVSKSDGIVIQPPRLVMKIPDKQGVFLNMPAYSKSENILGCKLVTAFPNNKNIGIPSIFATILLLDGDTGKSKAVMEGSLITGWRTAAASTVATECLHKGPKNILAILGAGVQAETHALALHHTFKFKEIRIWNRTKEHGERLASILPFPCVVYESAEKCVKDADVICTTTFASEPILKKAWLKPGAHVNAVGAGVNHHSELEEDIYRNAFIGVEHRPSAENELNGLIQIGIEINCEIGEFISNNLDLPNGTNLTVFQSMGIAIEDVSAANLIYNLYLDKKKPSNK